MVAVLELGNIHIVMETFYQSHVGFLSRRSFFRTARAKSTVCNDDCHLQVAISSCTDFFLRVHIVPIRRNIFVSINFWKKTAPKIFFKSQSKYIFHVVFTAISAI